MIQQSVLRRIRISICSRSPSRQIDCCCSNCVTALLTVHIFRDQIGVFIGNTDQPADIIVRNSINFHCTVDLSRIDADISSAIHRHQPAVACTGDFAGNIDLTAVRSDAVSQQLFGRRIIINLHLIIPNLSRAVPDLATAVDAVSFIAHDLVITQRTLVCCPTGV